MKKLTELASKISFIWSVGFMIASFVWSCFWIGLKEKANELKLIIAFLQQVNKKDDNSK